MEYCRSVVLTFGRAIGIYKQDLIEEPTVKAIETFNRLYKEGRQVSGGFHVGC